MNSRNMQSEDICVRINPGICGFMCHVRARRMDKYTVQVNISESGCDQVKQLAAQLNMLTLREVTAALTRNPIYQQAERCGCHSSCVIPMAVVKAAEAALRLALPQDAGIEFRPCKETGKI